MLINGAEQLFLIFFGLFLVLGIGSGAFFFFNHDAELKRRVLLPHSIAAAVLFVGFAWALGTPTEAFAVIIPLVALITVVNLRAIKFCSACGKTLISQNPFSPPKFCSQCGTKLGE